MGEIEEGSSRNMYKGHMDRAKAGRINGGRWGWVGQGRGWGEMETTILVQQLKNKATRKKRNLMPSKK